LSDEQTVYCPLCGNKIPKNIAKCPVCSTPLDHVVQKAGSEMPSSTTSREDYLHKAIPQIQLPIPILSCPQCALPLEGGEGKCPRCGIPLATEEAMLECPECGALAPQRSKACPNCGVGFEETPPIPGPPPVEEIVTPPVLPEPPMPVPPAPPQVVTSVPVSQEQPSTGFVNGRGAVNGTGFVNGTGITNGTKVGDRISVSPKRQKTFITRWQFIAVLVALVVVIPTFLFLSYSGSDEMAVDGKFRDWDDIAKFGMFDLSDSSAINIDEWAVSTQESDLFMYLSVEGALMASSEVIDSFYLFIDSDDSDSTGYTLSGIGADYMFQLDGWNGSVQSTSLSKHASPDHHNWSAWQSMGSLSSAVSGSRLEARGQLPGVPNASSKYVLVSKDNLGNTAVSYAVPEKGGLLVIQQEAYPDVKTSGVVQPGVGVSFIRLTFLAQGSGGTVTDVQWTSSGVSPGVFSSITLNAGETRVVDVPVDVSASAGELVSSSVDGTHVTSTFSDVSVIGDDVKAYVTSPPSVIEIDGAFADWEGRFTADADPSVVPNPDVNITATGAVNDTLTSSFYVSVEGGILNGSYIPAVESKPSHGGGGGTVLPPRKTGEDILRVYVDTDLNITTGEVVVCSSKTVGADFLIELKGMNGVVISRGLYSYDIDAWSLVSGAQINVGKDEHRMELGISSTYLSGSSDIEFVIETTDWHGVQDVGTSTPAKTSSFALARDLAIVPERWVIDGSTTSASATAMSYQRKLFHDGTNFWSFYFDGTNTVYKYSTDAGVTWTLAGQVFTANGVDEVSIWYDQANSIVYAVGDRSTASRNVNLQKGTVNPSAHTITWLVADSTLATSTNNLGGKNTFLSLDTSGYVWVLSTNLSSVTPTYGLNAWKSVAVGGVSSFTEMGSLISFGGAGSNLKGLVLPAGSDSNVWAIYMSAGSVYSRKYTGSWSVQSTIYNNLGDTGNQDLAPASAVVDGNGVIHVVYGNGHAQKGSKPFIYYVCNSGSSWSTPYRLDSVANAIGNFYPTISLDASTGNVYAFWIQTDSKAVGRTIVGKVNVSGTWTSLTFSLQTTDQKQYLTSIYSVSGEVNICWQWTQNTTGTIHVVFDKLPEFSDVVLPTFVFMCVFFVVARQNRIRRRRGSDNAGT